MKENMAESWGKWKRVEFVTPNDGNQEAMEWGRVLLPAA